MTGSSKGSAFDRDFMKGENGADQKARRERSPAKAKAFGTGATAGGGGMADQAVANGPLKPGRRANAATGGSAEPLARARAGKQSVMKGGTPAPGARGETASLKGGLTHGMSAGPYDGRDERRAARTQAAGVMGAPETTRDMHFYTKKRAVERVLGREISLDEFLADFYVPDDAATAMGTSIFDPVLCEIAYRWFCPPDGLILDPFAGGSVRGVVAGMLGREYVGIDLRPEQVFANRVQAEEIFEGRDEGQFPRPRWVVGDSAEVLNNVTSQLGEGRPFDFIFSCPPYADLERYSDDPRDLSTMEYADFLEVYDQIIQRACARLMPDAFACFVVGDVRDPDGNYRSFPQHTIESFARAGLKLYNDAILVTAVGSLPVRAGRQFAASRKVGTTHQRFLVFLNGNAKRAVAAIGAVEFGEVMEGGPAGDDQRSSPPVAAGEPSLVTGELPPPVQPITEIFDGITVVRDDLFPGGTKARFIPALFEGVEELVYASPCEGGAQTALATVAAQLGKRVTIVCAGRKDRHPRTLMAERLGAKIIEVRPGYLSTVQKRATEYAAEAGARLLPFGLDTPLAGESILAAARLVEEPDVFWCASGSGTLYRALRAAWPNAQGYVVQIGRELTPEDVPGAKIVLAPYKFGDEAATAPPFPSDPHYDAKAWEAMKRDVHHLGRRVVFWNVTGPAA